MEEEDQAQFRLSGFDDKLLNGILDEGTLVNHRAGNGDLADDLIKTVSSVHPRLVRYLQRGIAYHHPQLKNKGRLAVEGLFRNRHVQLIFSTWTLALGVHMPTRTVAFVKDSIELDALQYRQSSGRAGRRGFDIQGNIVFIDIPIAKIRHLTMSAIPNIQTHFPASVTFLIRLLHSYTHSENKKEALNRAVIALQSPFNSPSSIEYNLINIQMQFHCLHTLEFLYRLNLIDENGNLVGPAGFLIHLQNYEPANILFVYLMSTQIIHQMNDLEEIVNLLACLFANTPWPVTRQKSNNSSSIKQHLMSNMKFSLRPISSNIRQRINTYNSLVKEIYGSYIENVIKQIRSFNYGYEYILPYSNISFNQSSEYDNGTFEYNLHHHYSQQTQNPSISPFAGPSGLTHNEFMSKFNSSFGSWDLAYDLDLSPRVVPFIEIDPRDHTNSIYYMNSYALDFFRHGSESLLISENELDRADTYGLISEFVYLLSAITKSLELAIRTDTGFFKPLGRKLFEIQLDLSKKLSREFK